MSLKKTRRAWTESELAVLKELYPTLTSCRDIAAKLGRPISSVFGKARELGLRKPKEYQAIYGRKGAEHPRARANRFKKGSVPANKGKPMSPERYAICKATMFKKGQIPHNHRPVGSERVSVDGYIEIKVAEPKKWRQKHRVVWEAANGPIPKGYNVQFRNKNRQDCRIENLDLISRRKQLLEENSIIAKYPKPLREVIWLKGAVKRQIIRKSKKQ
jgi:hypothetical protein